MLIVMLLSLIVGIVIGNRASAVITKLKAVLSPTPPPSV